MSTLQISQSWFDQVYVTADSWSSLLSQKQNEQGKADNKAGCKKRMSNVIKNTFIFNSIKLYQALLKSLKRGAYYLL